MIWIPRRFQSAGIWKARASKIEQSGISLHSTEQDAVIMYKIDKKTKKFLIFGPALNCKKVIHRKKKKLGGHFSRFKAVVRRPLWFHLSRITVMMRLWDRAVVSQHFLKKWGIFFCYGETSAPCSNGCPAAVFWRNDRLALTRKKKKEPAFFVTRTRVFKKPWFNLKDQYGITTGCGAFSFPNEPIVERKIRIFFNCDPSRPADFTCVSPVRNFRAARCATQRSLLRRSDVALPNSALG